MPEEADDGIILMRAEKLKDELLRQGWRQLFVIPECTIHDVQWDFDKIKGPVIYNVIGLIGQGIAVSESRFFGKTKGIILGYIVGKNRKIIPNIKSKEMITVDLFN